MQVNSDYNHLTVRSYLCSVTGVPKDIDSLSSVKMKPAFLYRFAAAVNSLVDHKKDFLY